MFMTPTSINEVFNTIYSLKKSNSTGSDGLSTKVIQFAAKAISAPLTYIVNKSFELWVFPNEFKCTKVVPIFKKGKADCVENYRPISLINNLVKCSKKLCANVLQLI